MILARIDSIIYNIDKQNHTVAYAEACQDFTCLHNDRNCDVFQHVVGASVNDAAYKLAHDLRVALKESGEGRFNERDFAFELRYSSVFADRVCIPGSVFGGTINASRRRSDSESAPV